MTEGTKQPQKANVWATLVVVLMPLALILWICGSCKDEVPKTAAEERSAKIESAFSSWDGSHRGLEKVIKASMNDPNSYEHVETKYWDREDHLIIQCDFRGKNAFGGVVKNSIRAKADLEGNIIEIIK